MNHKAFDWILLFCVILFFASLIYDSVDGSATFSNWKRWKSPVKRIGKRFLTVFILFAIEFSRTKIKFIEFGNAKSEQKKWNRAHRTIYFEKSLCCFLPAVRHPFIIESEGALFGVSHNVWQTTEKPFLFWRRCIVWRKALLVKQSTMETHFFEMKIRWFLL